MDLLRGWWTPLLTLTVGGLVALAIAMTSFRFVRGAHEAEGRAFTTRIELAALLAASVEETDQRRARLAQVRDHTGVLHVVVLDEAGSVVEAVPDAPTRAVLSTARTACARAIRTGQASAVTEPWADGERWLQAACAPISNTPRMEPQLSLAVGQASHVERWRREETTTRAAVMGVSAVVALVVIFGVRAILAPVRRAALAAERMAGGERGVRLPPAGAEEVDQLSSAINSLASTMEAQEDEIRSRLTGMSQLTSMVAHEVRNPLQSLSLLCTLARTERDDRERDQLLASIETEIHVLEGVVQRFLRSSGPLQISKVQADLGEVAQRAVALADTQARARGVTLEARHPDRLPLNMDASLVRRAIENLLLNAIEFSAQEPPGRVAVSVAKNGREAVITVDDNGPGVPEQERDRVFKAYYSSKAGGTGLGLALVKQVFESHGGSVRCEASPLGGARFVARLPIDESVEVSFARGN